MSSGAMHMHVCTRAALYCGCVNMERSSSRNDPFHQRFVSSSHMRYTVLLLLLYPFLREKFSCFMAPRLLHVHMMHLVLNSRQQSLFV